MKRYFLIPSILFLSAMMLPGCSKLGFISSDKPNPRLVMFIGVDISGSFLDSGYFDDSLNFLSHYIFAHLNGHGDLEVPHSLFVGSLGGEKPNEPKTLFPIQTFQNKSIDKINEKLKEIFPKSKINPFTDYNAFFNQIASTVKNRKLILKPVSVVMISDGKPDVPGKKGDPYRLLDFNPLEKLSRNITMRLLYTDAVVGANWQSKIPRRRVKVWTQDAAVMVEWKEPTNLLPNKPFAEQTRFFKWLKDNVDFGVRAQRVK